MYYTMPTYNFRNKETNEEFEITMRIAELDKYKEDNPHLEQFLTAAPKLVSGVNHVAKIPDWHKDNLREMKKTHRFGNFGQAIE